MDSETRRHGWPRLPQLFTRKVHGDLITAKVGEGAQGVAVGKNIFQNVTVVVTALPIAAVSLAVAVAVVVANHHTAPSLPPMTGDINIAVAQFGTLDTQGHALSSQVGSDLADSLYRVLSNEFSDKPIADFDIQLRQPSDTGRIAGSTPAERAKNAAKLAGTINANVIIYGNLKPGADQSTLIPEFYLAPQNLQAAEELELSGYVTLGQIPVPDDATQNPVSRAKLRSTLTARTHALSLFIIGMGYYQVAIRSPRPDEAHGGFVQANTYLKEVQSDQSWSDQDGKEVLYLYLGSTAGHLGDLKAAESAYAYAIHLNPEYARAWVALAEVRFQLSRGQCPSGHQTNAAGLREALRDFERAQHARLQPVQSDMPTWVALGLGKTYLCLSQGLVADNWSDAAKEFKMVIATFDRGDGAVRERIKELAAEAHGDLGLVYLLDPHTPQTTAAYRRIADEYRTAIALTVYQTLQASYYGRLEYIYGRLKEDGQAKAAYAAAIRLDPGHTAVYKMILQQALGMQHVSLH